MKISTANIQVSTASPPKVSTIVPHVYTRRSAKYKGKAIMEDHATPKKVKKRTQVQLSIDEELARKMEEEERIRFNADQEARALQEKEKERLNMEAARELQRQLDQRQENKLVSIAQARRNMTTYMKNQGGYKESYFKRMSYNDIRPIFERVWDHVNTFIPIGSEVEKDSSKPSERKTSKIVEEEKVEEEDVNPEPVSKRQKKEKETADYEEEKHELRMWLTVVPDEEEFVYPKILHTKFPIVDWESQSLYSMHVYKIMRADENTSYHKTFESMLKSFNKHDLEVLHKLVMERFQDNTPKGYNLMLWSDLKILVDPKQDDDIWKKQNQWKRIKKKYPITKETLQKMLNWKLEAKAESFAGTGSLPSGRVNLTGDEDPTDKDKEIGIGVQVNVSCDYVLLAPVQVTFLLDCVLWYVHNFLHDEIEYCGHELHSADRDRFCGHVHIQNEIVLEEIGKGTAQEVGKRCKGNTIVHPPVSLDEHVVATTRRIGDLLEMEREWDSDRGRCYGSLCRIKGLRKTGSRKMNYYNQQPARFDRRKSRYSAFKVTEVKTDEPKALVSVDSMVNWSDHAAENTTGAVEKVPEIVPANQHAVKNLKSPKRVMGPVEKESDIEETQSQDQDPKTSHLLLNIQTLPESDVEDPISTTSGLVLIVNLKSSNLSLASGSRISPASDVASSNVPAGDRSDSAVVEKETTAVHSAGSRISPASTPILAGRSDLLFVETRPAVPFAGAPNHVWYPRNFHKCRRNHKFMMSDSEVDENVMWIMRRACYASKTRMMKPGRRAAPIGYFVSQATAEILVKAEAEIRNQGWFSTVRGPLIVGLILLSRDLLTLLCVRSYCCRFHSAVMYLYGSHFCWLVILLGGNILNRSQRLGSFEPAEGEQSLLSVHLFCCFLHVYVMRLHILATCCGSASVLQKVNTILTQFRFWWIMLTPFGQKQLTNQLVYAKSTWRILDWVDAMQEEMQQFTYQKNKARLVASGPPRQRGGHIDYDVGFATSGRIEVIRTVYGFCSSMGFLVYQLDVKSAFLMEKLEKKYLEPVCKSDLLFCLQTTTEDGILTRQSSSRKIPGINFRYRFYVDDSSWVQPNKLVRVDLEVLMKVQGHVILKWTVIYAGFIGDRENHYSVDVNFGAEGLISWQCKKVTIVDYSSTEARVYPESQDYAGVRMFLLVVILPAASLVSAGSSMFLLVVILPAARIATSCLSCGSPSFTSTDEQLYRSGSHVGRLLRQGSQFHPHLCRDVVVAGSVIQTIQDGLRDWTWPFVDNSPLVYPRQPPR
ncbi:ribonuclease H-like domain-containing protein [Tanacetum coccineum]